MRIHTRLRLLEKVTCLREQSAQYGNVFERITHRAEQIRSLRAGEATLADDAMRQQAIQNEVRRRMERRDKEARKSEDAAGWLAGDSGPAYSLTS